MWIGMTVESCRESWASLQNISLILYEILQLINEDPKLEPRFILHHPDKHFNNLPQL